MLPCQPGILKDVPAQARYLTYVLRDRQGAAAALRELQELIDGDATVLGVGRSLVTALGGELPGLGTFPAWAGAGLAIPSTPAALWLWLRGDDRGELVHRSRRIEHCLAGPFQGLGVVDAFKYKTGFDLTGYADGTENPVGEAAVLAALVPDGDGLAGSSYVAVQEWQHDLDVFAAMSAAEQDNTFGRRRRDNEEFDEAPESAHVKRTAQESYQPQAFILRRSMPWANEWHAGLMFVAFGHAFAAFESILKRMTGQEDGITDALFRFTRPVSGGYFWCPPLQGQRLNLSRLGV